VGCGTAFGTLQYTTYCGCRKFVHHEWCGRCPARIFLKKLFEGAIPLTALAKNRSFFAAFQPVLRPGIARLPEAFQFSDSRQRRSKMPLGVRQSSLGVHLEACHFSLIIQTPSRAYARDSLIEKPGCHCRIGADRIGEHDAFPRKLSPAQEEARAHKGSSPRRIKPLTGRR
jgi:hypothetical protein